MTKELYKSRVILSVFGPGGAAALIRLSEVPSIRIEECADKMLFGVKPYLEASVVYEARGANSRDITRHLDMMAKDLDVQISADRSGRLSS